MFSTKCDSCKNKPWSQCCDWCLGKTFHCFICNKSVTYREKQEHMQYHYYDKPEVMKLRPCFAMLCHLRICKRAKLVVNQTTSLSSFTDPNYTCKSCTKYNRNPSIIVIINYN